MFNSFNDQFTTHLFIILFKSFTPQIYHSFKSFKPKIYYSYSLLGSIHHLVQILSFTMSNLISFEIHFKYRLVNLEIFFVYKTLLYKPIHSLENPDCPKSSKIPFLLQIICKSFSNPFQNPFELKYSITRFKLVQS